MYYVCIISYICIYVYIKFSDVFTCELTGEGSFVLVEIVTNIDKQRSKDDLVLHWGVLRSPPSKCGRYDSLVDSVEWEVPNHNFSG